MIIPPEITKKIKEARIKKSPHRRVTNFFTSGSNGGIDDEYYINEIIGIDECNYDDFTGGKKND